jgi:hypothetical protein
MNIKTTLKTSVAVAALFAVAAPVVSSPAEAGLANGNDNGVVISGAINRSLMYSDNGSANGWLNTDGGTDNSRLRILVSGQVTESIKVGGTWEANLPLSNSNGKVVSSGTTEGDVTNVGDSAFALRHSRVDFSHATMGSLSIGQGSSSSDNRPGLGSTASANSGMSHGGLLFVFNETTKTATAVTGGSQFSSYFGTRRDRLRYDTPSIGGFKLSGSMGDSNFWDAGLTYGATYGDIQVAAAAQVAHGGGTANSETAGVGIAFKHASGLSAGAHYGGEYGTGGAATEVEGKSWHVEAGYVTSAISNLGDTAFEVIYTESEDTISDLYDAKSTQFHFHQNMPAGIKAYAAYEIASFDDGSVNTLDDITVFLVGTKLSF